MILFKEEYVDPILSRDKTITRRAIRSGLPCAGSYHQARINYATEPFAYLYVFRVWRERLSEMTESDLAAAGVKSREEYRKLYLSFYPDYTDEIGLCAIEFLAVTKQEYNYRILVGSYKEGDMVKIIEDGVWNRIWYNTSKMKFKNEGREYRVMHGGKMLKHGVRVAHLEGVRGYYDEMKLWPVRFAVQGQVIGKVVEDEEVVER